MNILLYLSECMIPFVFFVIIGYGLLKKVDIFDAFTEGVKDGFKTVYGILPTLIGLIVAVGVLRSSGTLDGISSLLSPVTGIIGLPAELVPLISVKMFSSSAATGILLDIFKQYGPDSHPGFLASVLMSCQETIFYTMSVYFVTAKIKHTRYTLAGALCATVAGIIASIVICVCIS